MDARRFDEKRNSAWRAISPFFGVALKEVRP
ncbi:hypothetical protein O206_12515 [Ochrobactrum sp. EGD-AQ16]|uniref:Uncharacterized protein n=1 Tax=Brucella intermedia 229E TaxID=1337887 RepID=U4VA38_9HYPH|nr:hypothetical protein O206_12515 [Ochrobactrum sp. EGD-AQ16]ERM02840.1 hypothetical protein Q644_14490 [Brucella intermedia 229E]